jgi:hypothetical protein
MTNTFGELLSARVAPDMVDAAFVLRNHDYDLTMERLERAAYDVLLGKAATMVMVYEPHTKAEADMAMIMAKSMHWKSMTIVTHLFHRDRAYLTFLRTMEEASCEIQLYHSSVMAPLRFEHTLQKEEEDLETCVLNPGLILREE